MSPSGEPRVSTPPSLLLVLKNRVHFQCSREESVITTRTATPVSHCEDQVLPSTSENADPLKYKEVAKTSYAEQRIFEYSSDSNSSCTSLLSHARSVSSASSEGSESKAGEIKTAPPLKHKDKKKHQCTQCGKSFSQNWNLKQHLRIHTGEKSDICEHCGKSFNQISNFKRHLRIHTGDKPYKCTLCGKCFSYLPRLKAHQLIHTGEKPFSCTSCGKKFSDSSNLKKHELLPHLNNDLT